MNSIVASSAPPAIFVGWTNPSRSSVVSGDRPSRGSAAIEVSGELHRVHELPLRGARVRRTAPDRDRHLGGVEGLRLDLAQLGAVECVGELGSVALDLEMVGAAGDLLVDREADANRSVLEVGVPLQIRDGGHDLRDTRLVVCAEKRRAVGRDDVVAELLLQQRQLLGIEHDARVAGQLDHAAVVAFVHLRLDTRAGHVRRGVDMRDQPDRRRRLDPTATRRHSRTRRA